MQEEGSSTYQQPPSGRTLPFTSPSSSDPCDSPQTTLISTFGVGCALLGTILASIPVSLRRSEFRGQCLKGWETHDATSAARRSWYDASTSLCCFGKSIHLRRSARSEVNIFVWLVEAIPTHSWSPNGSFFPGP